LFVALCLILAGGYLIVTQGTALANAREALDTARSDLRRTRASNASARADRLYLEDAVYGTTDFLAASRSVCDREGIEPSLASYCAYQSDYLKLLDRFNVAAQARTSSEHPKNYNEVAARYQELAQWLSAQPSNPTKNGWLARAHEGLAYARLKQNRVGEARAHVDQARAFDSKSGIVALTWLKVACAEEQPIAAIRQNLDTVRTQLDREVQRVGGSTGPDPIAARNATLERRLLDGDEELYLLCSYAELTPTAA
jgi:hypothetical protein